MSTFDADSFLNQSVEGEMATKMDPVPEGDYTATIDKVTARESGDYKMLDLTYLLIADDVGGDLAQLKETLSRDTITVRQTIFLDVNEHGGFDLGPNKNVRLGRLREIVGQNNSGAPWSPNMLVGAGPLVIRVTIRPDKNDDSLLYNDVGRMAPMAA